MSMELCIHPRELRRALAEVEAAEANGFDHCLAVFRLVSAGPYLEQCIADYRDLFERAHPADPRLNWGRHQAVSKHNRLKNGQLVPVDTPP